MLRLRNVTVLDRGIPSNIVTDCTNMNEKRNLARSLNMWWFLQGNVGLARLLLERGAHVEGGWKASEERCTLTPLQLAVATGNTQMVSLLLAHGANACLSTLDKVLFSIGSKL